MINLHKFGWCILAIVCQLRPGVAQQMGSLPQSSTGTSFGALFIETRGPRSEGVLFTSDSVATAAVYDNGFDIRVSERSSANCEQRTGATLRFRFETAGAAARAYGSCVQPTEVNYMIGSAAEHRTRRRSFAAARIDAVATGCDAVLRREFTRSVDGLEGELRYDLEFAAGAAVDGVVVAVAGLAGPLRIDPSGRLVAPTALGDVTQTAPTSWERLPDGTQRRLASRFVLLDDARYGFEVDDRSGAPLTIDPTLLYSTYLGGTGSLLDLARAVATDYNGGCVVVGDAGGASFPASIGAFDTTFGGGWDMFVARVSPGGVVLWATFIGGSADDQGWGVAFGPLEEVWAVGATQSTDFPTANAFAATFSGVWDAAVCRLSADGSTLLYGSYFGGPNDDQALAACSDATGDLFVAGHAGAGFPVTPGAADVSYGGAPWDGFAMRVSPGIPAPIWSTYLGGGGEDSPLGVALSPVGDLFVAGETTSTDFPTTVGSFDVTSNGGRDGFVTRIAAGGGAFVASTYVEAAGSEFFRTIAVDAAGNPIIGGRSTSALYPITAGAFDAVLDGSGDGVITKLDASLSTILWSTFFGGASFSDWVRGIAVDAVGNVHFCGHTAGPGIPTTVGAFQPIAIGTANDAFYAVLDPSGSSLIYSTFIGGAGDDQARAMSVDLTGSATLVGLTNSANFPTASPWQPALAGTGHDWFVLRWTGGVSGFSTTVTPTPGGGAVMVTTGLPTWAVEGWTVVSTDTTLPPNLGPVIGMTPDALFFALLNAFPVPAVGNPFHWIPVPGFYPLAPFSMPTGSFTAFAGQSWDFKSVAVSWVPYNVATTLVSRVTW